MAQLVQVLLLNVTCVGTAVLTCDILKSSFFNLHGMSIKHLAV